MTNINEMTVTELKALLFDFDQEVKSKQSQMSQIARVLQAKLQEEQDKKGVVDNGTKQKQNK